MKLTSIALLLSIAAGVPAWAESTAHWSYEGKGAPEHWGELGDEFKTCNNGKFQSPIDIHDVIDGKLPPLDMIFHTETESIVNNGHTIQVTVKDGDDFKLDNEKFTLMQFHFHAPSENRIAGKSYPLEAHFVHANDNGELAVIAVMLEVGAENPALNALLAAVPEEQNKAASLTTSIDLSPLYPAQKQYYRFSGSLTTPPCTEGLRWLVMKHPVTLSEAQLKQFQHRLKHANNRPVQPLHGRVIVE
ncbi:carbonic anhydrase [Erwinia sp. AnSW2-5]|uniref:carbonic anhydrase n=1 Tax=Erwinia sp. AnSW2-5 TaxID=3367692 RepID=UPI00385D240C